jgi:predicted nucleic acid-binding protein
VVIDADVLIGALDRNDDHHNAARAAFTDWQEQADTVLVSVVNLTEVLVAPANDRATLSAAREAITVLGVGVHQPNEAIAVDAARLRGRHAISVPDAYCLATARYVGATLCSYDANVLRAAAQEADIATLPGT